MKTLTQMFSILLFFLIFTPNSSFSEAKECSSLSCHKPLLDKIQTSFEKNTRGQFTHIKYSVSFGNRDGDNATYFITDVVFFANYKGQKHQITCHVKPSQTHIKGRAFSCDVISGGVNLVLSVPPLKLPPRKQLKEGIEIAAVTTPISDLEKDLGKR